MRPVLSPVNTIGAVAPATTPTGQIRIRSRHVSASRSAEFRFQRLECLVRLRSQDLYLRLQGARALQCLQNSNHVMRSCTHSLQTADQLLHGGTLGELKLARRSLFHIDRLFWYHRCASVRKALRLRDLEV